MSCVKYCTFQHLISHHCLVNIECHGGRIYVCVILDHHILQVDVKHFYQHLLDLLLLQRNNIYINILVILINILLIYRVSRNKWIKWDTPFLGHLLTQQAVLLRGDRVLRRIWFFTIGEAAWSTCGNSHEEKKKEKKDRFHLSLHKPSYDHILGFQVLGFPDFEIPGFWASRIFSSQILSSRFFTFPDFEFPRF